MKIKAVTLDELESIATVEVQKSKDAVIREIRPGDDHDLAKVIRDNFIKYKLDIPGTAYYDPELDYLSRHYLADSENRKYFVLIGADGKVLGGVGLGRFEHYEDCAEMQKLYIADSVKGLGYGRRLVENLEKTAIRMGFKRLYLETHSNLTDAIHLYKKMGYQSIGIPDFVNHSAMDTFFIKDLVMSEEGV